ncbi:MAG TPA: hypothetical protein VGN01_16295 [Acidobacteriaceae bacterium]|jgi:hypothetical protein
MRMRTLLAVAVVLPILALPHSSPLYGEADSKPAPKIVKDSLQQQGGSYFVKGVVYNPSERGMKNVVIKYYVWMKLKGTDGHGRGPRGGGMVVAKIKYLPPKQMVEFDADGDEAPVETDIQPDPLGDAEVTAEWDE